MMKYGEELMNTPIETLYNIFNHRRRKLSKHNETYEIIKKHFEQTKDSNIFILLDFLDGNKLTRKNIEESYSKYETRNHHMPKIDFSYLSELFSTQRQQSERILNLEKQNENQTQKYEKLHEEQINKNKIIETFQNQINNLTQILSTNIEKQHQEEEKLNKLIKLQEEQIEKYEKLFEEERIKEENNKTLINTLQHQINNLTQFLETNTEKQLKEEEQIIKLTKNNDEQILKYEKLLQEQLSKSKIIDTLQNQIEKLTLKLGNHTESQSKIIKKHENQNNEDKLIIHKTIEQLEERISKVEQNDETQNIFEKISEQKLKITDLEIQIKNSINENRMLPMKPNNYKPFKVAINQNIPGILQRLKNNEISNFDPLFIVSQSSNDIYKIIDPKSNDGFAILSINDFVEIELKEPVSITGIKIFSSSCYFPKSFDIEINDKKVASIKDAEELNGKNKYIVIDVDPHLCKKVRLINKGDNSDTKENGMRIKRIELISNDIKYSRGVFTTLVSQSEDHDPHKCPIFISASNFDFNFFYNIDSSTNICTLNEKNSWIQIEFLLGKVVLNGFRLKRCDTGKMKSYKIICSNDVFQPEEEWIELIKIEEKSKDEHQILDIYKFSQPSPPIKFIRLIQTGPNWSNTKFLEFVHLDFFGSYLIK